MDSKFFLKFKRRRRKQHYIDFNLENRSHITILESLTTIEPTFMKEVYSDFSNLVGTLKFKETIHVNYEEKMHVNTIYE